MQGVRTLPATVDWRWMAPMVLLGALFAFQAYLGVWLFVRMLTIDQPGFDWQVLTLAGERIAAGIDPYAAGPGRYDGWYRWHPLAAWFFYAIAPLGIWAWRLLNLASLLLLRDWRLIAAAAVSWPVWEAMFTGNSSVLVVAVGFAALSGSRVGGWAFLALCALIPRPYVVPAVLWLLWRRPELRVPAAIIFAGGIVSALLTGWGDEWIRMLLSSSSEIGNQYNYGPSRWLGPGWLLIGIPLGAWLTWKGRVGLAGLAVSPYLFVQYGLAILWEWRRVAPARR